MLLNPATHELEAILQKAVKEILLDKDELLFLLRRSDPADLTKVFETAQHLRNRYFADKVFLYGFVYFSTYCRNDCAFCLYRKSNNKLTRYRKTAEEMMETALSLAESGVHLLDFTMGEDPIYFNNHETGFGSLIQTIKQVKERTGISLMISPGVVSEEVLTEFKRAGVDWYACYQETHHRDLYRQLRLDQSYDERMNRKIAAREMGLLVEEGLLAGVGDTDEDIIHSIEAMRALDADQVRVMSFVPQQGTPMAHLSSVPHVRELLIIAVMRLVFPDRLIPASLDVDGLKGLDERLKAGANVVTSIIPPESGLAGVSNQSLDIEDGNRSIQKILPVLMQNGLTPASRTGYTEWVIQRQHRLRLPMKGEGLCG